MIGDQDSPIEVLTPIDAARYAAMEGRVIWAKVEGESKILAVTPKGYTSTHCEHCRCQVKEKP